MAFAGEEVRIGDLYWGLRLVYGRVLWHGMGWDEVLKSPVSGSTELLLTLLGLSEWCMSLLSLFYLARLDRYLCTFSCLSSLAICSSTPNNNEISMNKIGLDHLSPLDEFFLVFKKSRIHPGRISSSRTYQKEEHDSQSAVWTEVPITHGFPSVTYYDSND